MKLKVIILVMGLAAAAGMVIWLLSARSPSPPSEPHTDLSTLKTLPYVDFVTESDQRKRKTGVDLYLEDLCYPGVNIYCNHFEDTTGAFLMSMTGEILHQWTPPEEGALKFVTMDREGNIFGSFFRTDKKELIKMNWESQVLFSVPGEFHHDIDLLADGRIVTLRREKQPLSHKRRRITASLDYLVVLSPEGKVLQDISLFDVLKQHSVVADILNEAARRPPRHVLDLLHTNTVQVLDRDFPGLGNRGDVLLCMRNLDLIVIYDYHLDKIKWEYLGKGVLDRPHEPTLLDNGHILIFDNGYRRGWSRVIEIDPATKEIVWQYRGDPKESFFTKERGSIQRFPNGNTLITESDSGRVFEITWEGEMVWEWFNPLFSSDKKRAIVYRMKRLEFSVVRPLLETAR